MYIKVFLFPVTEKEAASHYSEESNKEVKIYKLEIDEALNFARTYADSINEKCDSLLGIYDSDFFNTEKCILLNEWLLENKEELASSSFNNIYDILKEYTNIAINNKSGIMIDL